MQRIEIVEQDAGWLETYRKHVGIIARALGNTALRLEHAGSISVPGLAAKPMVDVC